MKLGSLFDGSGGFPLAGIYAGMTPVWASEIEPYPIAVTRQCLPGMKHLGDVSKINGAAIEPVDVITFGSPCQDMSIAGKRAGMKHSDKGDEETTRSGMFYEAIRIIKEMREATNGEYPKYAVWENVPGAFSSNRGEDFRCVLEQLAKISGETVSIPQPPKYKWLPAGEIVGNGYSVAWRVLDAQYWGVPQRRKRIYLVADFGGGRAGKILFERDGLPGNPQPGGAERQTTADDAAGSTGGSDRVECLNPWDSQSIRQYATDGVYPSLNANSHGGLNRSGVVYESSTMAASFMGGQGSKAGGIGYSEQIAPTIKSAPSGGNTVPDVVYALQGNGIDRAETAGCNGKGWRENECYTLNTIDRPAVVYDARGNGDGETVPTLTGDHQNRVTDYTSVCVMAHGRSNAEITQDMSPTLNCNHEQPIVAMEPSVFTTAENKALPLLAKSWKEPPVIAKSYGVDCRNAVLDEEKTRTLQAKANGGQSLNCTPSVLTNGKPPRRYIVRRLTPLECCRLQGFPDGWGDLPMVETFSDDEIFFWEGVRKTHALIMGKKYTKAKNMAALVNWYNKLHTDSAEYKMWGNGIALPCARFVLEGIAWKLTEV